MKALILNSGLGSRMGKITKEHPKCMTEISEGSTILSRQLTLLEEEGIHEAVITTGALADVLTAYCDGLLTNINVHYVKNNIYKETNYIYSIYCARELLKDDDIVLMHGDLVFEKSVLHDALNSDRSVITVSSSVPLPEKDFKAVINNDRITKIGIEFFKNALAAQPLYKLFRKDWLVWLENIEKYIESGETSKRKCYAENAFNDVSDRCHIYPLDVKERLCMEVDNQDDLKNVKERIKNVRS